MTKTILGKVALTPRGTYNETTAYERLDVITHQGSSYLVLQPFSGIEPGTANGCVMLLASKGEKGEPGEKGAPFTYDDFTPEQLFRLKGEPGEDFQISGHYETLLDLEALVPDPQNGDAYLVGSEIPYDIYIYFAVMDTWFNIGPGPMSGEPGSSAYEIAVLNGFEGTMDEWLSQWLTNGENEEDITVKAPAITLQSEEDLYLRTDGKVFYNEEEVATLSDLIGLVNREELQEKINQLGAITYIALITDDYEEMQALQNLRSGAIALVREEDPIGSNNYKEYIWLNPEEGWEFLGMVNTFDVEQYYTKEEVRTLLSGKMSLTGDQTIGGKKNFTGSLQFKGNDVVTSITLDNYTDYRYTVMGLISLDATEPQFRSMAEGRLLFVRNNGVSGNAICDFICSRRYNEEKMDIAFSHNAQTSDLLRPVTFTYQGVKYGGIGIFKHTAPWNSLITFTGRINGTLDKPFLINYYDTYNKLVLNEEIYNSLSIAGDDITYMSNEFTTGITVNGKKVATIDQLPQAGSYKSISNFNSLIELGDCVDLRRSLTNTVTTVESIQGFTGGIDGMEYKLTLYFTGTLNQVTIHLPVGDDYKTNQHSIVLSKGEIVEISIRHIFGKYIVKVL